MSPKAPRKPVPPPPGATLLLVEEVAHELRVSIATVYREIADGKLPRRMVRGKQFVHRDDLAAYLARCSKVERTPEGQGGAAAATPQRINLRKMGLWDGTDY